MSQPLRGDELLSCLHRIALSRGAPVVLSPRATSVELRQRGRAAEEFRESVLATLRATYDGVAGDSTESTLQSMRDGVQLILRPSLPDTNGRRARVHGLWRTGKIDGQFSYAPLLVKNSEVFEPATTRSMLRSSLSALAPVDGDVVEGIGPRSTPTVTRSGLALAHALRVLDDLGHADPSMRVALIDRNTHVWWFALNDAATPRFAMRHYDDAFAERASVLLAHDEWVRGEGPYPTTPYWHRDCDDCPYRDGCRTELERSDDVSLVHYTNRAQQDALRTAGVTTRRELAALDARAATRPSASDDAPLASRLAKSVERLDTLIYRARVDVAGTFLRALDAEAIHCPTADVEVDVDMESYDDMTYLWGATVRLTAPVPGVVDGAHSFVTWDALTPESEASVFRSFWHWLHELREQTMASGHTFAAYCFWAQAEDSAMDRALLTLGDDAPEHAHVTAFRRHQPPQWIDLHDVAKRSIQTDGPLGLKHLAKAAGFSWRDEHPSGEASMGWYEVAVSQDPTAMASRERLLQYNEDDCRATAALRDWLNGPAKELPHRDDREFS